tara:strand:+ start:528 stop:1676 length:1149 start_codon:yes stop_codon:yes gene_type:complete
MNTNYSYDYFYTCDACDGFEKEPKSYPSGLEILVNIFYIVSSLVVLRKTFKLYDSWIWSWNQVKGEQEENKTVEPYEEKFDKKFNKLSYDFDFSESDLEEVKKLVDSKVNELTEKNNQEISRLENLSNSVEAKRNDLTDLLNGKKENLEYHYKQVFDNLYKDNYDEESSCLGHISDFSKFTDLDSLEDKIKFYQSIGDNYFLELQEINDDIDRIKNSVNRKNIEKEIREKFISDYAQKMANNFVMENTPEGTVIMTYKDGGLEYFSDNHISYKFVESVGKKFITTFLCKYIWREEEIEGKEVEEKDEESKEKQELEDIESYDDIFFNRESKKKDTTVSKRLYKIVRKGGLKNFKAIQNIPMIQPKPVSFQDWKKTQKKGIFW